MLNIILKILMFLVVLVGVTLIYDARILTQKFFSFGDQNEGSAGLKFLGAILTLVGGIVLVFLFR